jgi:hypothetical protein
MYSYVYKFLFLQVTGPQKNRSGPAAVFLLTEYSLNKILIELVDCIDFSLRYSGWKSKRGPEVRGKKSAITRSHSAHNAGSHLGPGLEGSNSIFKPRAFREEDLSITIGLHCSLFNLK